MRHPADTVVVMAQGHIDQAASTRDIYGAPRKAYVARFIGARTCSGLVTAALTWVSGTPYVT
jgi:ABC-type Fe3+/spermidine/putrescine transport system ATPase subunit